MDKRMRIEMNDSYIIVVTDVERDMTRFHAEWQPELPEHAPEQRDVELYRHAQPELAQMINAVGSGAAVVHIELTIA